MCAAICSPSLLPGSGFSVLVRDTWPCVSSFQTCEFPSLGQPQHRGALPPAGLLRLALTAACPLRPRPPLLPPDSDGQLGAGAAGGARAATTTLETPQRKWASSRLEQRTSWIFSSCGQSISIPWGLVTSARSQAKLWLRTFWSEALQTSLMHSPV